VRRELIESCSLTASFIKVEILLIWLENLDLVWKCKFTARKLSDPLAFLRGRTARVRPLCRGFSTISSCEAAQQAPLLLLNQRTLSLRIYFGFKDPILLSLLEALMLKTTFLQSWQFFY